MKPETNHIEYKQQLTDDLEKEVMLSLILQRCQLFCDYKEESLFFKVEVSR
jgi:hypothetical protein